MAKMVECARCNQPDRPEAMYWSSGGQVCEVCHLDPPIPQPNWAIRAETGQEAVLHVAPFVLSLSVLGLLPFVQSPWFGGLAFVLCIPASRIVIGWLSSGVCLDGAWDDPAARHI
jgi:hypothetical protein